MRELPLMRQFICFLCLAACLSVSPFANAAKDDAKKKADDAVKKADAAKKATKKKTRRFKAKNALALRNPKKKKKKKLKANRFEWGVLPAIAGNTDIGFGFGVLMNLAQFAPGFYPYRWRLEFLVFLTVKEGPDGGAEFPYHDYYLYLDLPGLAGGKLRLDGKLGFSRFTTSGYYGLGNAAARRRPTSFPPFDDFKILNKEQRDALSEQAKANYDQLLPQYINARRYFQYDRIYPSFRLNARYQLPHKFALFFGTEFTFNFINLYPNSKLSEDLQKTKDLSDESPVAKSLRELLYGVEMHPQLTVKLGVVYDSRNHELTPSAGMFHDLSVRFAPGAVRYPYGGVTLHTRFFFSLYKEYLVLAVRVLGDVLFGRVPFYEMTAFGGLFPDNGTGGSKSIRGIPTQRYHGKIKLLGNVELRSKIIFFNIGTARFTIGLIAFFDAGRTWLDFVPRPELDGEDLGLKMSAGGGLQIQWGESFLVRAWVGYTFTETNEQDPALPFTGNELGVYIGVGQCF